jgi:homoserine kinase type II
MAIYTRLSFSEVSNIINDYSIGILKQLRGIKEGIENTNYLLITTKGKYILTVFEKRVNIKDLPFFMNLMNHLNSKNIICPNPIHNKFKKNIFEIKNKKACISTFVLGKAKNTHTLKECEIIGNNIAKLHLASKGIKIKRKNNLSLNSWLTLNQLIKNKGNKKIPGIHSFILQILNTIKKYWPKNIPTGIIHGDLFPDNIFFQKNKFNGFIDFYFSCNDFLIYDLAICINALCFNKRYQLDETKKNAILKGYSKIRRLTQKELQSLPILSMGAAIRFFLTRLYDQINQQKNAVVKIKNPKEYLNKIKFYEQTKSYQRLVS